MPSAPVPAGWYPDPAGSFQQRWWNGTTWTNDFAQYRPTLVNSAPAVEAIQEQAQAAYAAQQAQAAYAAQQAAVSAQNAAAAAARLQTLERDANPINPGGGAPSFGLPPADRAPQTVVAQPNAGNATLVPVSSGVPRAAPVNPNFASDYLPFGQIPEVREGTRLPPEQRYTVAVWVLAVLPVLLVGSAWAVATYLPALYTIFAQSILGLAAFFAALALAISDRRSLRRAGHDQQASPAWVLLTPLAYLIARYVAVSRETERNAISPLVVFFVVIGAIAAALILVSGLAGLLVTTVGVY